MKRIKLLGIMKTPAERARGLMGRKVIPDDQAMLFLETSPRVMSCWMKNTLVPLQVAFVGPSMRIVKTARMRPLSLKSHSSDEPCLMAFEMLDGAFEHLDICEGQSVLLDEEANELVISE